MKLSELLKNAGVTRPYDDRDVTGLENDSRKAVSGNLFIAVSGYVDDAHVYIESAYRNGCRDFLIAAERLTEFAGKYSDARMYPVADLKTAYAAVCRNWYHDPTGKLKLAGITGTSGKTTTASAVYHALRHMGLKAGLIGTIDYRVNDRVIEATNTTPDLLALYRLFDEMVQEGVEYCVMEVSSHSLQLGRVAGLEFDLIAFTNLSQDHLDFHKTMEDYLKAKLMMFDYLTASHKKAPTALINRDMPEYSRIRDYAMNHPLVAFRTFSVNNNDADYSVSDMCLSPGQTVFSLNGTPIQVTMMGITNVYNFTLASAILLELGFPIEKFIPGFKDLRVRGRVESVPNNRGFTVIVDYAHKPDALRKLLETVEGVIHESGRIITVFGCGGDRDKSKRPVMGKIAGDLSDYTIVTSDNPRTEDPMAIIQEIEVGIRQTDAEYRVIENRKTAIREALTFAKPHDVIVIAGKGHEDYQILGKQKHHFSDREEVLNWLKEV